MAVTFPIWSRYGDATTFGFLFVAVVGSLAILVPVDDMPWIAMDLFRVFGPLPALGVTIAAAALTWLACIHAAAFKLGFEKAMNE